MAQPPGWVPGADPGAGLQALLRLWAQAPRTPPSPGLAERLASWLDWRDAVSLSQAMAMPLATEARGDAAAALAEMQTALTRLCGALQAGFVDATLLSGGTDEPLRPNRAPRPQPAARDGLGDPAAAFRLHHLNQQRTMAARIAPLRALLRERLSAASPRLARLAALDEVFEQALAAREQQSLAALPALLSRRAAALQPAAADDEQADSWPPTGWRGQLWTELQRALRTELELRLQPLLGLLDALHHEAATRAAGTPISP